MYNESMNNKYSNENYLFVVWNEKRGTFIELSQNAL